MNNCTNRIILLAKLNSKISYHIKIIFLFYDASFQEKSNVIKVV